MRKTLKKYFIPHKANAYTPHIVRKATLSILGLIAVGIFAGTVFTKLYVDQAGLKAAVLPAVVYDLTNEQRTVQNESELAYSATLAAAAQLKADDMAKYSYFAHTSPTGVTPWFWFTKAGYNFYYAGENLAVNFSESKDVSDAWMASPGHRANILNTKFSEIGIATADGIFEGHPTTFVVQLFGAPARPSRTSATAITAITTSPKKTGTAAVTPKNPNVKGEEATTVTEQPPADQQVKVITDDHEFLAVQSTDPSKELSGSTNTPETRSTLWQRFITNPSQLMVYGYIALGAVVFIGLWLAIFVEIKKQYPRNIFYGISFLVFLVALFFIYQHFFETAKILVV